MDLDALEPGTANKIWEKPHVARSWFLDLIAPVEEPPVSWTVFGTGYEFGAIAFTGEGPAVVFLPQLDGTSTVARYVARRFARAGYQVIALLPPAGAFFKEPTADDLHHLIQHRIKSGRLASRIAATELQAPCQVIAGLSLGAIISFTVAALEPEIDAVVSMLGGANLTSIARNTSEAARAGASRLAATDRERRSGTVA